MTSTRVEKLSVLLFGLLILVMVVLNDAQDREMWRDAVQGGTEAHYQIYLELNPYGEHCAQAVGRIAQMRHECDRRQIRSLVMP